MTFGGGHSIQLEDAGPRKAYCGVRWGALELLGPCGTNLGETATEADMKRPVCVCVSKGGQVSERLALGLWI